MDLTPKDRLLLANQYEILKRLQPEMAKHYDLLLKCLYNGYLDDFEQEAGRYDSTIDPDVQQEVRDILQMFRALDPGYGIPAQAVFAGFDGNEEPDHYAYARFLLEDRNLWRESKDNGNGHNTHSPVLDDYRAMLEIWDKAADKQNLTADEVEQIVKAAPYVCKPKAATGA